MAASKSDGGVYFSDVYSQLAAPFDETFKDNRGGVFLEYITGEQCITRLNQVLGMAGWSFTVKEHGINEQADEAWVLAELQADCGGTKVLRQQFGSQKLKRSRASGQILDIGFDLKGAGTDALKKCATLLGVGLYLSHKEPRADLGPPRYTPDGQQVSGRPQPVPAAQQPADLADQADALADDALAQLRAQQEAASPAEQIVCAECGDDIRETKFRDGTVWPPAQLAGYGRRKHNRPLCMEHYKAANEARRRAERSLEEVPFEMIPPNYRPGRFKSRALVLTEQGQGYLALLRRCRTLLLTLPLEEQYRLASWQRLHGMNGKPDEPAGIVCWPGWKAHGIEVRCT